MELLDIASRELKFVVEPKKLSECTLQLRNKSDQYVAFKIKTTSPKKYCVRPNLGVINPWETCDFTVTMQAQRTAPSDLHCRDKFLVQSTVVPTWMNEEDIPADTFTRNGSKFIEDKKLRVVLVNAPSSPVLHPANEELKQDPVFETPALKDASPSGVETVTPPLKIVEDVKGLENANNIGELETPIDMHKPVLTKDSAGLGKDTDDESRAAKDSESPEKGKDIDIDIESRSVKDSEIIEKGKDIDIESRSVKDSEILEKGKDMDDGSIGAKDSESLEKGKETDEESRGSKDLEGVEKKAKHMDDEPRAAKTVDAFKSVLELKMPKTAAELRAKRAMALTFEFMEKVKPGLDTAKFRVAHDLGVLKSKHIVIDTKLREAEIIMRNLVEERSMVNREKDNLEQEMEILKKGNVRKVEVGFPFLYVCSVALISMTFGYILNF